MAVHRAWPAALVLLLAVACTRPRPPIPTPAPEPTLGTSAQGASAILITSPKSGVTVSSPVRIEGTARRGPGQILAAQVRSREGGQDVWRGTGSLAPDERGQFTGEVRYHLTTTSPGVIEVDVVDPVGGTVVNRQQVEVTLNAAP